MFAVPAYPLEEVIDPTGAGDTFAGGIHGLPRAPRARRPNRSLRTAVVYGSVLASFVVERFSLDRLLDSDLGGNRPSLPRVHRADRLASHAMELSIVIPLYNERDNLAPLHEELDASARRGRPLVRDDVRRRRQRPTAAPTCCARSRTRDPHVRVIRLARNSGQTAALACGLHRTRTATSWSRSTATARTIRPISRACWRSSTRATTW